MHEFAGDRLYIRRQSCVHWRHAWVQKGISINVFVPISVQHTISGQMWSFVWYSHTTTPVYKNVGGGEPTLAVGGGCVAEIAAVVAVLHRSTRILYVTWLKYWLSIDHFNACAEIVLCYRCAPFKEVSAILHEEIHIQMDPQYVLFGIFCIF